MFLPAECIETGLEDTVEYRGDMDACKKFGRTVPGTTTRGGEDTLNKTGLTLRVFGILPMVPLEILPMIPLVANGTIGNQRNLNVFQQPMVPLVETLVPTVPLVVPMVPLVSQMASTVI